MNRALDHINALALAMAFMAMRSFAIMDDRSAGQTRPSIFVSLRYGSGDLTEMTLSKVIVRESYSVLAAAILIWSDQVSFAGSIIADGAVGGLDLEAIFWAIRDKRSLLSRIGPLP